MAENLTLTSDEFDALLRTLSHRHSRAVCHYFRSHSTETASVGDLVTFILEQDGRDEDEKHVAIHLHHATLPKLVDSGFIDYDQRTETVRYRDPELVELWLDHVVEESQILL